MKRENGCYFITHPGLREEIVSIEFHGDECVAMTYPGGSKQFVSVRYLEHELFARPASKLEWDRQVEIARLRDLERAGIMDGEQN